MIPLCIIAGSVGISLFLRYITKKEENTLMSLQRDIEIIDSVRTTEGNVKAFAEGYWKDFVGEELDS